MKKGYHILEIANVHGGDFAYFKELINNIKKYQGEGFGVKLQIFKSDLIALPDFSYYHIYEELFFDFDQWEEIINLVHETKDVWLDVFDLYGVQAVDRFSDKIHGLKFQASVLDNLEVFSELSKIDVSDKYLMLNISGSEIHEIKQKIQVIESVIDCKEIILQIGYQSYPTPVEKAGLGKFETIQQYCDNKIIYADHTAGTEEDALWLPILAMYAGAHGIEKHIMLGDVETKYDFQASLTLEKLDEYLQRFEKYYKNLDPAFINDQEAQYLKNTIQKPVTNKSLKAGKTPLESDFYYRRTDYDGLSLNEIREYKSKGYVLRHDIPKDETIKPEDFKKPTVAAIVACRLKSTRLKEKALLKIGELPSIQLCMKNAMKIKEANHIILATSTMEEDDPLKNHTYHDSVIFHKGDPEDVIRRYLDICDIMHIDKVIRFTGDCPYVSHEIAAILYESHLATGADYTASKSHAVGTTVEIIEVAALKKIKENFAAADYSEYMTWYFVNNPEHFKLNLVELPDSLVRDYRLTLDYQEDLDMFNKIEEYFEETNKEFNLVDLFEFLDNNPNVVSINNHLTLKYKTDDSLIKKLNQMTKIKN